MWQLKTVDLMFLNLVLKQTIYPQMLRSTYPVGLNKQTQICYFQSNCFEEDLRLSIVVGGI